MGRDMGEERDWGRLSIRLALSIIGTILLQATRLIDLTLFEALVIILLLFIAMSIA